MDNNQDMIQAILQSRYLGAYALLGAAMTYATFGVFIRAMADMFGDNTQVAVRLALVAIVMLCYFGWRRQSVALPRTAVLPIIALAVVTAVLVMLFTYAITKTTIASTVFSLYAGSIVTSLLIGTLIFKEHLSTLRIGAIVIALIGLWVYAGGFVAISIGVAAGFASGVFEGFGNALRKVLKGVSRPKVQLYQNALAAVLAAIVIPVSGEQAIGEVSIWPVVATLVFVGLMIGLGQLLLYGFQHFDVSVGTIILATELFFAAIVGWICYNEQPAPHEALGGILIFIASLLTIGSPVALWRRFRKV